MTNSKLGLIDMHLEKKEKMSDKTQKFVFHFYFGKQYWLKIHLR